MVDGAEEVADISLEDELVALDEPIRNRSRASVADRFGRNPKLQGRKSASNKGSRTILAACWHTLSFTVGMPKGLFDPSGLGISTRRTGEGRYRPARRLPCNSSSMRWMP